MPIRAVILKDEKTYDDVIVKYEEPDNVIIEATEEGRSGVVNVYVKDLFSAVDLLKAAYWHDRSQPPEVEDPPPMDPNQQQFAVGDQPPEPSGPYQPF